MVASKKRTTATGLSPMCPLPLISSYYLLSFPLSSCFLLPPPLPSSCTLPLLPLLLPFHSFSLLSLPSSFLPLFFPSLVLLNHDFSSFHPHRPDRNWRMLLWGASKIHPKPGQAQEDFNKSYSDKRKQRENIQACSTARCLLQSYCEASGVCTVWMCVMCVCVCVCVCVCMCVCVCVCVHVCININWQKFVCFSFWSSDVLYFIVDQPPL